MATPTKSGPTRESGNAYDLRSPCANCPFRTDVEPYIRGDRAASIADGLRQGGQFTCHKTTVEAVDEDGDGEPERVDGPHAKFCAGAMATMERDDAPNQLMRVGETLGLYDPTAMRSERQPVYSSLSAWVRAVRLHEDGSYMVLDPDPLPGREPEELEMTHCEVVAQDCEDPAGYGGPGGVHDNDDPPTLNPFVDTCGACGNAACPACRSSVWSTEPRGERYCVDCVMPDDVEPSDEDGED